MQPADLLYMLSNLLVAQVIELQLPSFFNNFDPRAAAANFPSGKIFLIQIALCPNDKRIS